MFKILEQPPEIIEKYLKATKQTREELEAKVAQTEAILARADDEPMQADPALKEKFTMPIGAIFPK
jgi:ABC-type nitrate/sulfonate/bicarbonate transport system substrate-binding protein